MQQLSEFYRQALAALNTLNPGDFFAQLWSLWLGWSASSNLTEWIATTATSFALIFGAEIGDKSQLVCMTLASRHKALPIMLAATAAFAFLNTLAIIFGVTIANWLPAYVVSGAVAFLFAVFGMLGLYAKEENDEQEVKEKSNHGIFFSTFLLLMLAEFGDKTQLAVVALSSTANPVAVWIGSTAALVFTSALGIWAGRKLLQKLPLHLIHKVSGVIFLVLAGFAGFRAYSDYVGLN